MEASKEQLKLTGQQQRVVKLLFKFRFVSAPLLSQIMGIQKRSVYEVLELIVSKELAVKVYESSYRIDRKPAYYYLSKQGVSAVRKLLDVKESVVHALYKNDVASDEFVSHNLQMMSIYGALTKVLPSGTQIFTKTEINRFKQFPKNRPDLYVRTPDGSEAIFVYASDKPAYITRKRFDEIITHSEEEGWNGDYPNICFIFKDTSAKNSFTFTTSKKLESIGIDDQDIKVLVTIFDALIRNEHDDVWFNVFHPSRQIPVFG